MFVNVYWNCACLIVNSGGIEVFSEEENIEDSLEDEDAPIVEEKEEELLVELDDEEIDAIKSKKKNKTTNYGKIAAAIGTMQSAGVSVSSPDINKSTFTFSPERENEKILYGLKGITRIGTDLAKDIINKRPFTSISDFLSKVKVNKTQMLNLIKSGAFDCLGDRMDIMKEYIFLIADAKKRVTLQNMQMLIRFNLLPEILSFEVKVYNFNKYIKKHQQGASYILDDTAFRFYEVNYDIDAVEMVDNKRLISITGWAKNYELAMNKVRNYIKENNVQVLNDLNTALCKEVWDKYCLGSVSRWEMESTSFYYHEHELSGIDMTKYDLADFNDLPTDPIVDKIMYMKGREVPKFRLSRIAGTVLDKDKNKSTITLLTTTGVVKVKLYKAQFSKYDKQISVKGADGKKKVVEKSWFSRGNKLLVTGIRREDTFVPKVYKGGEYQYPLMIIKEVKGSDMKVEALRSGE